MRKLILALWLLPALVGAQTLLTNVGNRHSTSLNGSWNYIVDPYETGYYNYRREPYDQQPAISTSAYFMNHHAVDFSSAAALNSAKQQLSEVIQRDKNRAAVIIWSMANETPPSEPRNRFLTSLIQHSRTLDIVAFNQYIGWYGGTPDDAPKAQWIIPFNKPVVMSEFGADALQGLHGIQDGWNRKGLISSQGIKKKAFFTLREYYERVALQYP